jgi:hypothetical protein
MDSGTGATAPHPRFYAFWAINAPLEQRRLRGQLDKFREAGLDGVVFHPRFYPGAPPYLSEPYFEQVSATSLYAKSIGLSFWLYDEDGWPSGTVGGQLLKEHPEHAQRWAGLFSHPTESWFKEFRHEDKNWYLAERKGQGVDYLDARLSQRFIGMTYERYRAGLSPEAFDHVEAFFCDEPEFGLGHLYDALPPDGAIPWTPLLPELYRERFGEDLLPNLPALFFPLDGHQELRIRFWEFLTDLFCQAFLAPLNDWCREHGKQFAAHIKGEEHPLFQVPMVGSCHQVFRHLSLPGIDALERYPSNHFYPRQVSSAARQFGSGRCMAEAFGGAGWGATPEDLERYLLWLGSHGITDFVLHLSQYRLDSAALLDWPPSQPLHLTWSPLYGEVIGSVRRQIAASPRPAANTLVVAPLRGIMSCYAPWELLQTNIHDAGTYPPTIAGAMNTHFLDLIESLHRTGLRYDVADERSLEESGQPSGEGWQLGRCSYQRVIVAEGCRISAGVTALLQPVLTGAAAAVHIQTSQEIRLLRPGPVEQTSLPVQWTLDSSPVNSWLLECVPEDDGWFTSTFSSRVSPDDLPAMEVVFADDLAQSELNGSDLPVISGEEGSTVCLPRPLVRAANVLRFRTARAVVRPFVWLQGAFRVASESRFREGPGNTIQTDGPFALEEGRSGVSHDLVAGGFPFLRNPLLAVAEIVLPEAAAALRLEAVEADAIRFTVDGQGFGWSWHLQAEHRFDAVLSAGKHELRIEMLPNTFNACGPHHYYGGDWFIVSPDQIRGLRNFADPTDAPERTHVAAWHFRRFQLPRAVTLLP